MERLIYILFAILCLVGFKSEALAYDGATEEQLEEVYIKIAEQTNLDVEHVKVIHAVMGNNCEYASKSPDIYKDLLTNSLVMEGATTEIRKMPSIEVSQRVNRCNNKYLPDALYSICDDIQIIAAKRYLMDRKTFKDYFDALDEDVKHRICLAEAVLIYTGSSEDIVNNYYNAYSSVLYNKSAGESVVKEQTNGLALKDKYKTIFNDLGFTGAKRQNIIATILANDKRLISCQSIEELQYKYVFPYKLNYTSRENMMVAAMSLIGKVRYVWGGGHSGACYMDGINPVWRMWNKMYPSTEFKTTSDGEVVEAEGFNKCIKRSGSWCPVHGSSNGMCKGDKRINSIDEYIAERNGIFIGIDSDKFRQITNTIDFTDNATLHTLEGLDCSGFASWLYNQITDDYQINSSAVNFTNQSGIKDVAFGEELLPGDIFSWTTHIVIIVGKVTDNSKAYVTVEQTSNVLKFGVVYYSGASQHDIKLAEQVALEGNMLLGNLYNREKPHVYCMNNVGKYVEEVPVGEDTSEQYSDEEQQSDEEQTSDEEQSENGEEQTSGDEQSENGEEQSETTEESEDVSDSVESEDAMQQDNEEGTEEEVKTVKVEKQIISIGRFSGQFIDEETAIQEFEKPLKDLTAIEIIQHTITKLPISYISGYRAYNGSIFDKSQSSISAGIGYYE